MDDPNRPVILRMTDAEVQPLPASHTAKVLGDLPIAGGSRWTDVACRALDIVLSLLLLVLLLPVFAAIAVAIRLDSPGRAIFRQRRVGRGLEPFHINKFRTMYDGAGHEVHRSFVVALIAGRAQPEQPQPEQPQPEQPQPEQPFYKIAHDHRVTRIGRFLRRSSLDELPQLWNVLRGEMSLVGPRPPIHYEVEAYPPHWFERFSVKPGITGLWQVSGRSQLTLDAMIDLDVDYARRRSLWLNVRILLRTVPAVLRGSQAA
jgi:lipopolysaccharide/colanic/teichoic acid biosynthesis glycosyltransferase